MTRNPIILTLYFGLSIVLIGILIVSIDQHTQAQATTFTNVITPETSIGHVDLDEVHHKAWGLSETDWNTYRKLMSGPSGHWYPNLVPAMVLGINAQTDTERLRFARIVWEQETQRLDALFAFNRSYQQVARTERNRPDFSFFEETLLQSPLQSSAQTGTLSTRITAFVGLDCPSCNNQIKTLLNSGRPFDLYMVGAESDRQIRIWARQVGIPAKQVANRAITLNHDIDNQLSQLGYQTKDLPLFFVGSELSDPVDLQSLLAKAQ